MTRQLELALRPRREIARTLRPLERLRAILRRRGIDPEWRLHPGERRGWLLPIVGLDAGDRHRTEARGPDAGLPAQGAYESLCAWCVNVARHCPEDRFDYRDLEAK